MSELSERYMEKGGWLRWSRLNLGCDCHFRHLCSVSDLTLLGGFIIVGRGWLLETLRVVGYQPTKTRCMAAVRQ